MWLWNWHFHVCILMEELFWILHNLTLTLRDTLERTPKVISNQNLFSRFQSWYWFWCWSWCWNFVFPLQLLVSVEAYLYVKNLTCCFESLWTHLTTSTINDLINVWLLLLPHHVQKTNFITQVILEIKLAHYSGHILAVSCAR